MLRILSKEPLLGAAILSGFVALLKFGAFVYSGSLIVLWSLLDSIGDTVISSINFRMEKIAKEDADSQHPFGHGGYEVLSSLVQAVVISASALFVGISGVERLFGEANPAHNLIEATIAMVASAFIGYGIGRFLEKAGQHQDGESGSLSHETDKAHYFSDFWLNLLSAAGLLTVLFFKVHWLDSIFAVSAAIFAVREVIPIFKASYASIVQQELEVEIQNEVVKTILGTSKMVKGVHRLRSRRHGSKPYVDFHLVLASEITLSQAQEVSDAVELALEDRFPDMDILIHLDPEDHMDELDWVPSYDQELRHP